MSRLRLGGKVRDDSKVRPVIRGDDGAALTLRGKPLHDVERGFV